MQVKEIDINTEKNQGILNLQKKSTKSYFRWSYHSDLLYMGGFVSALCLIFNRPRVAGAVLKTPLSLIN